MNGKGRVFVGLSGGVDSAVSAALLQHEGYVVTGVFIRIWRPEFLECTWQEDRIDAMRVAARLGIPFREVDLSEEYKREVIDTMIATYRAGITPNPDVLCNEKVKFGAFLHWAIAEGADMVATGHYARIMRTGDQYQLLRGVDAAKDQSYFLYRLGQEELIHGLFPVGGYRKQEVRELAERFRLPVAHKRDSQGLCFVGDIDLAEFLQRFVPTEAGPVLDTEGNCIGKHDGALFYTVGQRHGFALDGAHRTAPHYVVRIDITHNALIVSSERADAAKDAVLVPDPHWIGQPPAAHTSLAAQVRYHAEPVEATLVPENAGVRVAFTQPQVAAPGQSLVLYDGDQCLGGGTVA